MIVVKDIMFHPMYVETLMYVENKPINNAIRKIYDTFESIIKNTCYPASSIQQSVPLTILGEKQNNGVMVTLTYYEYANLDTDEVYSFIIPNNIYKQIKPELRKNKYIFALNDQANYAAIWNKDRLLYLIPALDYLDTYAKIYEELENEMRKLQRETDKKVSCGGCKCMQ